MMTMVSAVITMILVPVGQIIAGIQIGVGKARIVIAIDLAITTTVLAGWIGAGMV